MARNKQLHRQRSLAGIATAAANGRFPGRERRVTDEEIRAVMHLKTSHAAQKVGLSKPWYIRRRARIEEMDAHAKVES